MQATTYIQRLRQRAESEQDPTAKKVMIALVAILENSDEFIPDLIPRVRQLLITQGHDIDKKTQRQALRRLRLDT